MPYRLTRMVADSVSRLLSIPSVIRINGDAPPPHLRYAKGYEASGAALGPMRSYGVGRSVDDRVASCLVLGSIYYYYYYYYYYCYNTNTGTDATDIGGAAVILLIYRVRSLKVHGSTAAMSRDILCQELYCALKIMKKTFCCISFPQLVAKKETSHNLLDCIITSAILSPGGRQAVK
jgi:hypothetical protein